MPANGASAVSAALDKALAEIAARAGFKNPEFHLESGSNACDGFNSLVHRATISDKDSPDKPELSIIAKISLDCFDSRMAQFYDVEGFMYRTVLPAMEEIVGFKELPWPRCYHVLTEGPLPYIVALGDLQPEGFKMADRTDRFDAAHCRLTLKQAAKFHGAGLALQHLKPDVFRAMWKDLKNPWASEESRASLMPWYRANKGTADVVKDKYPVGTDVNASLVRLFDAFAEDNVAFFCPSAEPAPGYTLIHADCHINNWMFQYDEVSGAVTDCRLIDFQTTFYGNPAIDVTTVLMVCCDKPVRDKHWDSLVREYHAELQATLKAAGCSDPDAIYSWKLFQEHLALGSTYALCVMPLFHTGLFSGPEVLAEVKSFFSDPAKKEQVFPLNVDSVLSGRIHGLVEDIVNWGWLPSVQEIDRRLAAHAAY